LLCVGLFFAGSLRATPLEFDLGEGLLYFRAHELPADLPPAAAKAGPMVLDLRFSAATGSADTALDAWLKFHSTATTPVFVLVNSATPEKFLHVLAKDKNAPGFLSIGTPSADFSPDISVKIKPDDERKAYDALEHGTSLESLLTQNADKPRNDEAAIMQARANPPPEPGDSDLDDFADSPKDAHPTPAPPAPIVDVTLQRAVQLHRALVALKRL